MLILDANKRGANKRGANKRDANKRDEGTGQSDRSRTLPANNIPDQTDLHRKPKINLPLMSYKPRKSTLEIAWNLGPTVIKSQQPMLFAFHV